MCLPAVPLAIGALAGATLYSANRSAQAQKAAANVQAGQIASAEAERKAAESKAAQDAQLARADQKRRMRGQSLLTTGAQGVAPQQTMTSTLDYGKQSLGG
jgi:Flp pilus assembly protein TadB